MLEKTLTKVRRSQGVDGRTEGQGSRGSPGEAEAAGPRGEWSTSPLRGGTNAVVTE